MYVRIQKLTVPLEYYTHMSILRLCVRCIFMCKQRKKSTRGRCNGIPRLFCINIGLACGNREFFCGLVGLFYRTSCGWSSCTISGSKDSYSDPTASPIWTPFAICVFQICIHTCVSVCENWERVMHAHTHACKCTHKHTHTNTCM